MGVWIYFRQTNTNGKCLDWPRVGDDLCQHDAVAEWKVEASGLQGECQGSCQVRRMARPARIEASGRKEIPHGNWSHEPKCPAAIGLEELRLSSACYLPIGRFELFIVYHGRVTT